MMEKIEQQDALIKEMTTRGTEDQSGHVLKREDSKYSQLLFQFNDFSSQNRKHPAYLFFRNTLVEQKTKLK